MPKKMTKANTTGNRTSKTHSGTLSSKSPKRIAGAKAPQGRTKKKSKSDVKTAKNDKSVSEFLSQVETGRQSDCQQLVDIMQTITGHEPAMWGGSIVGFGSYHYKYESGREGDWFESGFSPRKQNLTIYIMSGLDNAPELLGKLGPYKTGKSCLYIKRLDDIHLPTLKKLIKQSVASVRKKYISR